MMRRTIMSLWLIITILTACMPSAEPTGLRGQILLWYNGSDALETAIQEVIVRFEDSFPDTQVVAVNVMTNLQAQYISGIQRGLGPDVMIASSRWLRPLAEDGHLRDLPEDSFNRETYYATALTNMRVDNVTYGIPFALSPAALYYNTTQIETPARTLDALLTDAANGHSVAMPTQFDRAFWGVQAFNGTLFGTDGRVQLDTGSFTSWLNWMKTAQDAPGMLLSHDTDTLRDLFVDGRATYYIGPPEELRDLQSRTAEGTVRAATLPGTQSAQAGPFLHTDAFMFNPSSSPEQFETALALAQFMTNREQSVYLAREVGIIPANSSARIDPGTSPSIAAFLTQSRTAIPMPNTEMMDAVLEQGDRLYRQVLDGVITVNEAIDIISEDVRVTVAEVLQPDETTCSQSGTLTLWHAWSDEAHQDALNTLVQAYMTLCPNVTIELVDFRQPVDLLVGFRTMSEIDQGPDAVLGLSEWTQELVADGRIQSIVDTDVIEGLIPSALDTVRAQATLYGIPITLRLNALYYNQSLVTEPPLTLDDLLTEAAAGRAVGLAANFTDAYWGIPAFGGQLFDEEFRVVLDRGGFADWLAWLETAQEMPGITIELNPVTIRQAFQAGDLAYIVDSSDQLADYRAALGDDLRVSLLPAGPVTNAAPLLRTNAVFFSSAADEDTTALAQQFVRYLTTPDNETLLLREVDLIPASVQITDEDSAVDVFRQQATRASIWPNVPQLMPVLLRGNDVYQDVLIENADPVTTVADFVRIVNGTNGLPEITPENTAPPMTPMPETTPEITPETN